MKAIRNLKPSSKYSIPSENVYRWRGESDLPLMFFYNKKKVALKQGFSRKRLQGVELETAVIFYHRI